jgi:hypothetical protein
MSGRVRISLCGGSHPPQTSKSQEADSATDANGMNRLRPLRKAAQNTPGLAWAPHVGTLHGGIPVFAADGKQFLGAVGVSGEASHCLVSGVDQDLEAIEIFEADRQTVVDAINKPGSKARNERGALSVRELKKIGRKRWPAAV